MTDIRERKATPLVSVIVCASSGQTHLHRSLRSVLGQTYPNLQVIVVSHGGESVGEIAGFLNRRRAVLVEGPDISGKAGALNRALEYAEGEYLAYLDDVAVFYPNHVERLVEALEGPTGCGAAYSDFYVTCCRVPRDGGRKILAKHVRISREFDRFCLCQANHVLRVSLMHRRDLLDGIGRYDERIDALLDWDIVRRLAFFTDLLHVREITGELYRFVDWPSVGSSGVRPDAAARLQEVLAIRSARPAKPWPKMPDLSVILAPERFDEAARRRLHQIRIWTFAPHKVYLPMPADEVNRLRTKMPNVVGVPVEAGWPTTARIDEALRHCEGDYVAVVPEGLAIEPMWVEPALHAMVKSSSARRAIQLGRPGQAPWAVVLRADELRAARRRQPRLSVRQSLEAGDFLIGPPAREDLPFEFDRLLARARIHEGEGNWRQAAGVYERILDVHPNSVPIKHRAAGALYRAGGRDEQALRLCRQVNQLRPTVESLLLEARLHRRADRTGQAVELLERARRILQWKG